jgi:hypothetical protein
VVLRKETQGGGARTRLQGLLVQQQDAVGVVLLILDNAA